MIKLCFLLPRFISQLVSPRHSYSYSLIRHFCLFCFLFAINGARPVAKQHDLLLRARRFLIKKDHLHFIIKNALSECKVPSNCVHPVESALRNRTQVPRCEPTDYFNLLECLDEKIFIRTNVTELNSKAGKVCCEMDEVSLPCQLACRSAMFAPTLSHQQKLKRIEMVCHRGHGDDIRGDSGLLNCLHSYREWMPPKHKMI